MFSAIHARKRYVLALRKSGKSTRQIASITGEHQTQICRWLKMCSPKKPESGLNTRVSRISRNGSVFTSGRFNAKSFLCFDGEGNPDVGTFSHPIDNIEPFEIAEDRQTLIKTAALRYLLRQESRSMEEVAGEIGCTRAAISRVLVQLSDTFGFSALNQKSKRARQSYRQARLQVVARQS